MSQTAHIENMFMDYAEKFVAAYCQQKGYGRIIETTTIKAIDENLSRIIRAFSTDKRYCPYIDDIRAADIEEFVYNEIVPDYADEVARELDRRSHDRNRGYGGRYDDNQGSRRISLGTRFDRESASINTSGYETAIKKTGLLNSVKKEQPSRLQSKNNNKNDTCENRIEQENRTPEFVIFGTKNSLQTINAEYKEITDENDPARKSLNEHITSVSIAGSISHELISVSYKKVECYKPFYKVDDVFCMCRDLIPLLSSPALYFNNIIFDIIRCKKLGNPHAKICQEVMTNIQTNINQIKTISDINNILIPIIHSCDSEIVKSYINEQIFKEFNKQLQLYLFRPDAPDNFIRIGSWNTFMNIPNVSNEYVQEMKKLIPNDFSKCLLQLMIQSLNVLFSPVTEDTVITATKNPELVSINPKITSYYGEFIVRDCSIMPTEDWAKLAEDVDNNYIIHKVTTNAITTNINLKDTGLDLETPSVIIPGAIHILHRCLQQIWSKNDVVECPILYVYNPNNVIQPIKMKYIGYHITEAILQATPIFV